ncbi:MAG: precorrin-2 C(20)-methyltransferase [Rhodobacterales bacterium]|nr:precorrin-2 C(20)-methyltransferase [Rhodobacterales bacterium]
MTAQAESQGGTCWGLGVGPGAPDLITLRAHRILQSAPVIAYPAPETGDSLARAIAAPHIPAGRVEIAIRTPMVPGHHPAHATYDTYAAQIADHLAAGRDVAVLCEGDPFFYGSFMYLFERLAAGHRVEVVPGVSSLGACAAAAGLPLLSRMDVLTVIPGPLSDADLERRLATPGAKAVMKVGRHLDKIRAVLDRLGLAERARYVERATMDGQVVRPLADLDGRDAPYFSMILVPAPDVADDA